MELLPSAQSSPWNESFGIPQKQEDRNMEHGTQAQHRRNKGIPAEQLEHHGIVEYVKSRGAT